MKLKEYTIEEAQNILRSTIKSNIFNREKYKTSKNTAIRFIGEHGIGKTEAMLQVCVEEGYAFKYLNLSEITEESSLYGFPRETYKISKIERTSLEDGTTKEKKLLKNIRVNELQLYLSEGWKQESQTSEMTYSIPQWVNELEKTPVSVLLMDEFSRAQNYISQAVMNLVLFGTFGTWKLPKGTQIVLLDNPATGDYNVSSMDSAQLSRFMNYSVKGDINAWVKFASKANIHEECINFLYKTPEIGRAHV